MFPVRRRNTTAVVSTLLTKTKQSSAEGLVIEGLLECDMAHHQQQLTGDISSDGKVWLAKGSDVRGNIHSACLYIEEGAQFTGQIETDECATYVNVEYS